MHTIIRGFVVGVAAVTLAACASASGTVADSPTGTPSVQPQWTSCAADAPPPSFAAGDDALTLPRLGGDFVPTAVIVCAEEVQQRADGAQDLVATESRADDVAALVTALHLPDEQTTSEACTADLPIVPWFVLLDAQGRWIRPGVAKDGCGKVRIEVRNAIAGLRLTRVATRVLREITSAAASASGCNQTWADMVSVETKQGDATSAIVAADPFPPTKQVRLCVYRVPASQQGTTKPAGDFQYGVVLSMDRQASIDKSLLRAAAARECSAPASLFALLLAVHGSGATVYIELDGCQRIMIDTGDGGPILAQADVSLVALLGH
jgi:hypothetical protein